MKRINVETRKNRRGAPFWMPWGIWGSIWRYLLFMAALFGFLLLLKWLLTQPRHVADDIDDPTLYDREIIDRPLLDDEEIIFNPDELLGRDDIDPELLDILNDEDFSYPYDEDPNIGNPNRWLPSPEDNVPPLIPLDDFITDPDNPFSKIADGILNVILNGEIDDDTYNRFAEEFKRRYPGDGYRIKYYNKNEGLLELEVPPGERAKIKRNLPNEIPDIDFKVFNEELLTNGAAKAKRDYNDPAFKNEEQSWHFAPIQAYEAWEITKGSPEIVVAVVDSYIDATHPEFKGRIVKPYNVERKSRNVLPPKGSYSLDTEEGGYRAHGTHVAGLAVGALNNATGASGLAPECKLMPVAIGSRISTRGVLEGILYAIRNGANVINVSIASVFPPEARETPLNEQIEYIRTVGLEEEDLWNYVFKLADERNVTIVWSAGNCDVIAGLDDTKRGENTIRVSAIDQSIRKADFSNYGKYDSLNYSDVSAPGKEIYSSVPGARYAFMDGTSMAAPIVTGAVALMKSVNPDLSNAEIIHILKQTGKPMPESDHIGPLIQVRDALLAAKGEFADFDEIKKDPDKIVGRWETTERLDVYEGDVKTDHKTHIFLEFDTPTSGRIIYKEDTGYEFTAPIKVRFDGDKILVDQDQYAKSHQTPRQFIPVYLKGIRDNDGRLKCFYRKRDKPGDGFYMRRVN